jgi:hypothetical protein
MLIVGRWRQVNDRTLLTLPALSRKSARRPRVTKGLSLVHRIDPPRGRIWRVNRQSAFRETTNDQRQN